MFFPGGPGECRERVSAQTPGVGSGVLPGARARTGKAKGETVGVPFTLGGGARHHRCPAAAEYGAFSGSGGVGDDSGR